MILRSSPHNAQEDGFTLTELIVALGLVAMLLVVASTVMLRSYVESASSKEQRAMIENVRNTITQFETDTARAGAPHREANIIGSTAQLSDALLGAKEIKMKLPGSPHETTLDVRDVLEATDESFMFRTEAHPSPGKECVKYWVRPEDRAFVRSVYSYNDTTRTCVTDAPLLEKVLVEAVR